MVEVLIEEMFRPDRNRSRDYQTSRGRTVVVDAEPKKQTRPLAGVQRECRRKEFDRADAVRDAR
jgi:hypothetical protein